MGTLKFNQEHYERVVLQVPKGWSKPVNEAAKALNISRTKYIVEAVEARLEQERAYSTPTYRLTSSDAKTQSALDDLIK